MLQLWHNSRCSKPRAALKLLEAAKVEFEVFHYLMTPANGEKLDALIKKLGIPIIEAVRLNEPEWRITGLEVSSPADAIRRAMVSYPILIQRPILETDDAAVIGRPPERILELL